MAYKIHNTVHPQFTSTTKAANTANISLKLNCTCNSINVRNWKLQQSNGLLLLMTALLARFLKYAIACATHSLCI